MASPLDILDGRDKCLPGSAYKILGGQSPYGMDVMALPETFSLDESKMSCWIVYADGNRRDGVGDLLEIGGIDTSRHLKNPIILWDHGKHQDKVWPIAMGCEWEPETKSYNIAKYTNIIDPNTKTAKINAYFYQGKGFPNDNPVYNEQKSEHALFSEQIYDMLCKRMLGAGSIGYQVKHARDLPADYQNYTPPGLHLLSVLMLEASVVVLPANMDTVRKSLCKGFRCCGKPLSPYLVKSLMPYAPPSKAQLGYEGKSQIAGDLGWLEEEQKEGEHKDLLPHVKDPRKTKIPPVRWRPGLGAINKGIREKYSRKKEQPKKGPKTLANGHVTEPNKPKTLRQWYKEKPQGLRHVKDLNGYHVKTNRFFAECNRDETGHCLPGGGKDEDEKKKKRRGGGPGIKKPPRRKSPKDSPFLVIQKRVGAQGAGSETVVFRGSKFGCVAFVANARRNAGEGSGLTYLIRKTAGGKSMPVKNTKALPDQVPGAAPPPGDMGSGGAEDVVQGEVDEPVEEKYSAQVLRSLHEHCGILLNDYHNMRSMLENDEIDSYVVKKCEKLVEEMEEIEGLFGKHHGDLEPLAGAGPEGGAPAEAGEASSETEELPPPEEAIEGMRKKALEERAQTRELWKQFKDFKANGAKTLTAEDKALCKSCGKEMGAKSTCSCGSKGTKEMTRKEATDIQRDAHKVGQDPKPEDVHYLEGEVNTAMNTTEDSPEPPPGEGEGEQQMGQPKLKSFFHDHEKPHVSNGRKHLSKLSTSHEIGDQDRMESYLHHHLLSGIADRWEKDHKIGAQESVLTGLKDFDEEDGKEDKENPKDRSADEDTEGESGEGKENHDDNPKPNEDELERTPENDKEPPVNPEGEEPENNEEGEEEEGEEHSPEELHRLQTWHKSLRDASKYLKGVSEIHPKEWGEGSRIEAGVHHMAMKDMEEMEPEEEEGGEMGEAGQKALLDQMEEQYKQMQAKNKELVDLGKRLQKLELTLSA